MNQICSMVTSMLFLSVDDTGISVQWQHAVLVDEPLPDSSRIASRGQTAASGTAHPSSCSWKSTFGEAKAAEIANQASVKASALANALVRTKGK